MFDYSITIMKLWIVLAVLIFCICCNFQTFGITRPSNIVLDNNGYKNILIAVDKNVPEDKVLIQGLKNTFTHASKVLYRATKRRAYFHSITILLPSTWADSLAYGTPSSDQSYNNADIVISNPTRRKKRNMYTRRYSGCGQPGIHMQLVSSMFTDVNAPTTFGPIEKMIVHQWGHFRWGLYDEYAKPGDAQYYFSPSTGQPEGLRCILKMRGLSQRFVNGTRLFCRPTDINQETMEYPEGCHYIPYPARAQRNVDASFMYHQDGDNIVDFCDEGNNGPSTEHNYEAPSLQNRKCGHRSTWEVMRMTADFLKDRNPPRDIPDKDITPIFSVVKPKSTRKLRSPSQDEQNDDDKSSGWIVIKNNISFAETKIPDVQDFEDMLNNQRIHIQTFIDLDREFPQRALLFADIRSELEPVTGLNVEATVIHPNMDQEHISLLDNGVGIDAESDDGIYSRSFSNFSQPGKYGVTIKVNNRQRRAAIKINYIDENDPHGESKRMTKYEHIPIETPLHHEMNVGGFSVTTLNRRNDVTPPSRISDLMLAGVSSTNQTIRLAWTAPGDDIDHGHVSTYEIRVSPSVREILKKFDDAFLITNSHITSGVIPKEFGERQEVVLDMSQISTPVGYAFAVIGIDDEGNRGPVSNIVTAGFYRGGSANNSLNNLNRTKRKKRSLGSGEKRAAFHPLGLLLGGAALCLVFGAALIWKRSRKFSNADNKRIPV